MTPAAAWRAAGTERPEAPRARPADESVPPETARLFPRELAAAIERHFKGLSRAPTAPELELLARAWDLGEGASLRGSLRLRASGSARLYKDLLDETVFAATRKLKPSWLLPADGGWALAFDKRRALNWRMRSIRAGRAENGYGAAQGALARAAQAVLAAGMGGKPLLGADVLFLGPLDAPAEGGPPARKTLFDCVRGLREYANPLGIPTASGALWFGPEHREGPTIFFGALCAQNRDRLRRSARPGDWLVAAGPLRPNEGPGASAPNRPLLGKAVLDAALKAQERGLYRAAAAAPAGLSAAAWDLARAIPDGGARLRLEPSPAGNGARGDEAESHGTPELLLLACAPSDAKALCDLFAREGVEAERVGELTADARLLAERGSSPCVDLPRSLLCAEGPEREASWSPAERAGERAAAPAEKARLLHRLLAHPNVCSREWLIRQYDFEAQGATVIKPLQGLHHDGPGDACVIWPDALEKAPAGHRGFALAHGLRPSLKDIDPYAMAFVCIEEALANLACVGADVSRAALSFDLHGGEDARSLGSLARAAEGCRDAALGLKVPVAWASARLDGPRAGMAAVATAVAPVADIRKAVTLDLKAPGNPVYLLGLTAKETGGALFEGLLGLRGKPPRPEPRAWAASLAALSRAAQAGLILSAHNLAEGGLAVAAAEMCFSGDLGLEIDIDKVPRAKDLSDETLLLFAETPGRLLVEVEASRERDFLKAARGAALERVGLTFANPVLRFVGLDGRPFLEEGLSQLKASWQNAVLGRCA